MRFLSLCLLLSAAAGVALAQAGSDHCEVAAVEMTGSKPANLKFSEAKKLGEFDSVMAEEELTTRIYRLPGTRLFIIASTWYTDESLASEKGADSVSLELSVSAYRKRDIPRSLVFADAETPVNGFDVGRVMTMVKTGGRTQMIIMECRRSPAKRTR